MTLTQMPALFRVRQMLPVQVQIPGRGTGGGAVSGIKLNNGNNTGKGKYPGGQ